eukprot:10374923-Prorocentrum_lima.AAC.1
MTSSLVGSEMCIRDSKKDRGHAASSWRTMVVHWEGHAHMPIQELQPADCLLYTSDAADDM